VPEAIRSGQFRPDQWASPAISAASTGPTAASTSIWSVEWTLICEKWRLCALSADFSPNLLETDDLGVATANPFGQPFLGGRSNAIDIPRIDSGRFRSALLVRQSSGLVDEIGVVGEALVETAAQKSRFLEADASLVEGSLDHLAHAFRETAKVVLNVGEHLVDIVAID